MKLLHIYLVIMFVLSTRVFASGFPTKQAKRYGAKYGLGCGLMAGGLAGIAAGSCGLAVAVGVPITAISGYSFFSWKKYRNQDLNSIVQIRSASYLLKDSIRNQQIDTNELKKLHRSFLVNKNISLYQLAQIIAVWDAEGLLDNITTVASLKQMLYNHFSSSTIF